MREVRMSLPELALIAATRGMLGVGIGMLLSGRLGRERVAIGATLAVVGALATIPLALEVFGKGRLASPNDRARPQPS